MRIKHAGLSLFLGMLIASWSAAVLAGPPAHAKAYGWRAKNDTHYVGYTGRRWDSDFGIISGRCDREAVATVIGGAIGAVVGSRVGRDEDRVIAVIVGAAAGAIIGNRIGRELDEADRGCVGHALEMGASGKAVSWQNERTGVRYEITPRAATGRSSPNCRAFTLRALLGDDVSSQEGAACHADPGVWGIANVPAL
jgi:surface antigen